MPYLHGHNASAVRADVARESPFGISRFLRPRKVHGNIRAVALLNPSVGKQRGVTRRWSSSIHCQYEPVSKERVFRLRYYYRIVVLCISAGLQTIRRTRYFPFEEIP